MKAFETFALMVTILFNTVVTLGMATVTMAFMSFVIIRAKARYFFSKDGSRQ